MKSGLEHWITEKKSKEVSDLLVNQDKHQFIRIAELNGRVINTAEIDEICTKEQMVDRIHLKNKDWQCTDKRWHEKGKKCYCAQDKRKAEIDIQKQKEFDEMNKPMTPEQRERAKKHLIELGKFLEEKGIITKKMII